MGTQSRIFVEESIIGVDNVHTDDLFTNVFSMKYILDDTWLQLISGFSRRLIILIELFMGFFQIIPNVINGYS